MKIYMAVLIMCGAVSGCAAPQRMGYLRIDGKEMIGDAKLSTDFTTDKTVCLGEMSKANMGGTVVPTGNVFIDAGNSVQRQGDANNVMLGCMAQHGYKLVALKTQ